MSKKIPEPVTEGVAKVPVVMQMEALECGAACLCMIMAYYEKWIPLEQVRKDCGVSRDGSNAANIVAAAEGYGFEADGYKMEPESLREEGVFPCIVHWDFKHFVVCNGFKGNKVYLNDPAMGAYTVPFEQFDESFTGIVLFVKPGEGFEPSGKKRSIWSFASERMKGAKAAVWFMAITTLLSSLCGILAAIFSRIFLDELLPGKEPQLLIPVLIGMAVLALLQIAAAWISAIYSLRLNGKMDIVGSSTYMWKVFRLPMEFFSQRMAGDIQFRKDANARIASQLVNIFAPLLLNAIMMIFYLVVMLRYSLILTLIGVTSVAAQLILSRIIAKRQVNITRVMMKYSGKLSGYTVSGMEMIESIKASGAENGYFEKWSGYQALMNSQNVNYGKLRYYLGAVPVLISEALNILVTLLGVYLVIRGEFTPGMVFAFQGFLSSFMSPAQALISSGQQLQEMRTDMERVEDVMNYPDDVAVRSESGAETDRTAEADSGVEADRGMAQEAEGETYAKLSGNLTMRGVTFGYSRLEEPLIRDFHLELKKGNSVALVGASGSGKSTLSKLISNLYQPWSGEILFDGKPASQIDRSVFTGSVAVVDQDIILFEDPVADNIKMWDRSIEDFEMILAARDAQIHATIMQREGAYQHKMLEGGKDFSGGERQRLEIARVLALDPTLIILDEATSALDARTEADVIRSIRDRGISCIVIAHRLSTIRDCDEIIVLDHGNVAERGTHQELLAMHGLYEQLVTSE